MLAPKVSRRLLRQSLRTVFAAGAVDMAYQPIVDLRQGAVFGYEALARPDGADGGGPEALLRYARSVEATLRFDRICRRSAYRGARSAALGAGLALFMNVEPGVPAAPCPVGPDACCGDNDRFRIVMEFTERQIEGSAARMREAARHFRAHGHMVALDDIGSDIRGQGSVLWLIRPEIVKLDRSVVQAPTTPHARAVAGLVSDYAGRTGAVVVAEGIESGLHLATARALGAHLGQGWLLGRPGPLPVRSVPQQLAQTWTVADNQPAAHVPVC